jgi:hypothetical protein
MNNTAEKSAPDNRLRAAQTWSWEDLSAIWQRIRRRQPIDGWPAGLVFEHLVLRGLELDGYQIGWPYSVSLPEAGGIAEQIDGVAFDGPRGLLVECKDLSEPAAVEALAKFRLRLERRPRARWGCCSAPAASPRRR